ncbi:hypothetical protein O4J56_17020 [Nocardiopsis sp. RSe5-2]|uniref:Uncharacterized protein n=1 Tax=Nocardiopsis endophytica TaxID=3018445 RepID=A0ABT4U6J3_9ACTN|nr:hypothetical protein [Nocardiopsis endophytica]MDA2812346.1 hypothetical protein [Nocardiopsis endophytica]
METADGADGQGEGTAGLVAAIALYVPEGEKRAGRVSSVTADPVAGTPLRAVVDFGSTPEGVDTGPDVEVATRLWGGPEAAGERALRGLCAERALMERRMRDPQGGDALSLGEDARWSRAELSVDGRPVEAVVLATGMCWVAAAEAEPGVLVRVYTPAPGPGPTRLVRVRDAAKLEPMRGRG